MLDKSYAKSLRRACTLAALSGFMFSALAGTADPQKLGYRNIAPDETATVTLLAQRILSGAQSGDPYLYLNFVAKDYAETAAASAITSGNRAALLRAAASRTGVGISASILENVTVSGDEASCTIIAKMDRDSRAQVKFNFAKRPEGWVLVKSVGLFPLMRAATGSLQYDWAKEETASVPLFLPPETEAARTFISNELSTDPRLDKLTRAITRVRL